MLLPHLSSMVTVLISCFSKTFSPICLDALSSIVTIFGVLPEQAQGLSSVFLQCSQYTFSLLETNLRGHPDVVGSYFSLLSKALQVCPMIIIASPSLPVILKLAVICLMLPEREAGRAVVLFLLKLLPLVWQNTLYEPYSVTIAAILPEMIVTLFQAIITLANKSVLINQSELLFNITNKIGPLVLAPHLSPLIANLQLANEHKSTILNLFMRVNVRRPNAKRLFQNMMSDIAMICNDEQTTDALLNYEMSI